MLLVATLWPALLGGFVLGALVGSSSGLPSSGPARAIALVIATLAAGLGGLALSGVVAGRPGFWIEASALILGAYLIGCVGGGVAGRSRGA
jgi:hypothetical protein